MKPVSIGIVTDKGVYIGGEEVTGVIHVKVKKGEVVCQAIMLKMTGLERTKWTEVHREMVEGSDPPEYTKTEEEHEAKKEFFKDRIRVVDNEVTLPEGKHEFRFQYRLPDDLPGVFHFRREYDDHPLEAKIVYKAKAYLDLMGQKDVKKKQEFVVHEKLDMAVKPAYDEKTGSVLLCCCIPRGQVTIKCWFEKNCFTPGDQMLLQADVNNESSSRVDNMAVKLMRVISISDKGGSSTPRFYETINEEKFAGMEPNTKAVRDMHLSLSQSLLPSTKSKFIECKYHVDVEAQIPMAPDVELHLPTKIFAPQPVEWGAWPE